MKSIIVCLSVLLLVTFCLSQEENELQQKFISWMKEHNKVYGEGELEYRFRVWKETFKRVSEHNAKKGVSYTMAINHLADLTLSEIVERYTGLNGTTTPNTRYEPTFPEDLKEKGFIVGEPDYWDWREHGAVTGVKDQGQCGSCWAFSTTGTVEGSWQRAGHGLVSLSESELVDCDNTNYGCNGGWPIDALAWIRNVGGIDTEASHPYHPYDGSCYYATKGATINTYYQVPKGDEGSLLWYVYNIGPVSVCIDVTDSWSSYSGGIYDNPNCDPNYLNHAVLVVGYGYDVPSGKDFWIVKNSWGSGWGAGGYIYMRRNAGNQCGIASAACVSQS